MECEANLGHGREAFDWLAEIIGDPSFAISIGAFGAVGQFSRGRRVRVCVERNRLVAVTPSASIVLEAHRNLRIVAFETISSNPQGWNTAAALCLPEADARMSRRGVWTSLGPDVRAIEGQGDDRDCCDAHDVGLGNDYVDVLVRPCCAASREHAVSLQGSNIPVEELEGWFVDDLWVFDTRLGRLEARHRGNRHIIAQLLSGPSTYANGVPIPQGFVPVGYVLPPNPLHEQGERARALYADCRNMLNRFGVPELNRWKRKVETALDDNWPPSEMHSLLEHSGPPSRTDMACLRIALRQRRWLQGRADRVSWEEAFDPALARTISQIAPSTVKLQSRAAKATGKPASQSRSMR